MENNRTDKKIRETDKAALMAAFLLALAVLYLLAGILFGFYIPCPFRALTGFRCPGCGMSHAATYIALSVKALITSGPDAAHACIMKAFHANALFIPIFAYLIYAVISIITNKENDQTRAGMVVDAVFLVIVLSWWVIRNILSI